MEAATHLGSLVFGEVPAHVFENAVLGDSHRVKLQQSDGDVGRRQLLHGPFEESVQLVVTGHCGRGKNLKSLACNESSCRTIEP